VTDPHPLLTGLNALHDWMREKGVTELTIEGTTLKLGPVPKPAAQPDDGEPVLDTEEPEDAALERKRMRYEKLLGRAVSAEEARDHLP